MTWRAIWGEPFPEHADHATEAEAHAFALRKSRDEGCEVAVVPLEGAKTGRSDDFGGSGACVRTSETKRGAERRTEGEA